MQFSKIFLAAAAFASAQAVIFTNNNFNGVTAGQDFEITWANATGSVTITLKNGPATDLKDVNVITGGVDGTAEKYTWSVPADLPADTYALEIDDLSGVPNYSIQFQLIGGVTTTSSSASSTSSSASSTSTDSTVTLTSSGTSTSTTTSGTSSSTGTSSSKTTTQSPTSTSPSPTETTTTAPNSAAGLASPLALIFLALAAILTLN